MKKIQRVLLLLTSIALINIGLEITLRLFDPLGVEYFYNDFSAESQGELYHFLPGHYQGATFDITIKSDNTRLVPDTPENSTCTVVAIGDSVTQGWSVDDDKQWLNLLAQQFPAVRFVNAGMAGFNSRHVMLRQQQWADHADFFIYYINENDVLDEFSNTPPIRSHWRTQAYVRYLSFRASPPETSIETHFWDDLNVITSRSATLVVVDKSELSARIQNVLPDVLVIDKYTSIKSVADPHPDEIGMQQIANRMESEVRNWIENLCSDDMVE